MTLDAQGTTETRAPRAFDIVDLVLYSLATGLFMWRIVAALLKSHVSLQLLFANLFIFLFVSFVFIRNYIVMRSIDDREAMGTLQFVGYGVGLLGLIERIFRALIVFIVITTPQGIFKIVNVPIEYCEDWFFSWSVHYMRQWGLMDVSQPTHTALNAVFPYYGAVLLILFVLFIGWDIVNVWSMRKQIITGTLVGGDGKLNHDHESIISIIMYMGFAARVTTDTGEEINYIHTYRDRNLGKVFVNNGRIGCIYVRSSKFWERICGVISSVAIILCAASNYSFLFGVILALSVAGYFVFVFQSRGFMKSMQHHIGRSVMDYIRIERPNDRPPVSHA